MRETLAATKGNKSEAAKILGISRKNLYERLAREKTEAGDQRSEVGGQHSEVRDQRSENDNEQHPTSDLGPLTSDL